LAAPISFGALGVAGQGTSTREAGVAHGVATTAWMVVSRVSVA
jgi:hypothetical protein